MEITQQHIPESPFCQLVQKGILPIVPIPKLMRMHRDGLKEGKPGIADRLTTIIRAVVPDPVVKELCYASLCRMPPSVVREHHANAVHAAFAGHYQNNPAYRKICEAKHVTPSDIRKPEDLIKIPMLPARFFKENVILSVPESDITRVVVTSATRGKSSRLPRDSLSFLRFGAINGPLAGWEGFLITGSYWGLCAPPPEEASLWITVGPFVVQLENLMIDTYVRGGKFEVAKIIQNLKRAKELGRTPRNIWGFHFFVNRLMDYMDKTGDYVSLERGDWWTGSRFLTLGGWKHTEEDKIIPKKDFQHKIAEHFNINEEQVIDLYSFGESNMIAVECEQKTGFHVAPFVRITIRDPHSPEDECDPEEKGLIGVYDPTINSYPAFVISDDMGYLLDTNECPCGRTTQLLEVCGRAPDAEVRSCGLKLSKSISVIDTEEAAREYEKLGEQAHWEDLL